ncbi:MAG: hypothetical protein M3R04_00280 [bacterium]|nr:hypothetical protein [bacterium]
MLLALLLAFNTSWAQGGSGTEAYDYGIAPDGVNYTILNVEVPTTGWTRVNFNGTWVWLWGSSITTTARAAMEADIVTMIGEQGLMEICKCSIGTGTCQCDGTCGKDGSYGHDCNNPYKDPLG